MTKFATAYPTKKTRVVTTDFEPTLTKQALLDSADINKIIKRYHNTGVLPQMDDLETKYGQITQNDLMEAHQLIIDAEKSFNSVPSNIRKQFDQSAGAFIDYATNPDNIQQMRDWGLAPNAPPSAPDPTLNTAEKPSTEQLPT